MARPEVVTVTLLGLVALAWALVPEYIGPVASPVVSVFVAGIRRASEALPYPAFLAAAFVVITAVALVVTVALGRILYAVFRRISPRAGRTYRRVFPSTPVGKIGAFSVLAVVMLVGLLWVLPGVVGTIGENEGKKGGPDGSTVAGFGGDPHTALEADAVEHDRNGTARAYRRPAPDADGDRLKDEWERAGETSGGVPLPGADPNRTDVYLQVDYGGGVIPLTERERRQLRAVWADMPVRNPDGSSGITLHVVDEPPTGGALGERANFTGTGPDEVHRYYTPRHLGDRACRYHQLVVGSIDRGDVPARASAPGYAAVIDSERREFDGDVPFRVYVITHALLHNVVGEADGDVHTERGWLSPAVSADGTFLSEAAAAELERDGLAGSGYYQERC